MKNKKWLYLMAALGLSLLTACGGGGGGGAGTSTGAGTGTPTTPAPGSEGTLASPVQLTAGTIHSGTVSASGLSYYRYTGLAAGATYSITLGNVVGSLIPFYYSSDTQANGQSCFYSAVNTTASCIVQASTTGAIFLTIGNYSLSGSSSYDISAALATDAGQGTPTAPLAIASPASHAGALTSGVSTTTYDTGNSGYYRITGLAAGHRYDLSLTPSAGNAILLVYQDSYAAQACSANVVGGSAHCYVTAKANSLLLQVRAKDLASFTLSHGDLGAATPFLVQGSVGAESVLALDAPTSLDNGSVNDTKSYYTVTRLVPGQAYYAYLNRPTDNIDLYVYRDAAYTQLACSSRQLGTKDESCTATPDAAGQLWIVADGSKALADLGSKYGIGLQRIAPTQGSSAQSQVISGSSDLPYRVGAGSNTKSYYRITGLPASTTVMTTLAGDRVVGGTNATLSLYADSSFSGFASCTDSDVYASCSGTTTAGGELFVMIDYGLSFVPGGTAYLDVKTVPVSQGAATAPLVKDMAALAKQFSGEVAGGSGAYSYYELRGLTPNTSYYILTSFGADGESAETKVFDTFSGDLSTQTTAACSNSWSYLNTACSATSDAAGKLWVQIGGWYAHTGTYFKVEALPVPVSQGLAGAALDLTGKLPYRSTVGPSGTSYYMVTNMTAGSEYRFVKSDTSAGESLDVYNDSAFSSRVCTALYASQGREASCRGKPTGSTVYLLVSNTGYQQPPGYHYLDITPVPAAEGSPAAPVAISMVGSRAGSVNVGASYYRATLAPNTSYTIGLSGVSGDPDLYVFNTAAMSGAAICRSLNGKDKAESCQATSDSNGNLWITVDGQLSKSGATYQLQIN